MLIESPSPTEGGVEEGAFKLIRKVSFYESKN